MAAPKVEKAKELWTGEKSRTDSPWNVILHNDWETSVMRVLWVLVRVIPGMSVKKATKVMWTAHWTGRAVAKRCHKELLVELYEELLREKGLTVSIEPSR